MSIHRMATVDVNTYTDITPTMTSATAPSGYIVSTDGDIGTVRAGWHAFDHIPADSTGEYYIWHSNIGVPAWIMLKFPTAKTVSKFSITNGYMHQGINAFKLQGSNDGTNFTDLGAYNGISAVRTATEFVVAIPSPYIYYRIYITSSWHSGPYCIIDEIKFYETISTTQTNANVTISKQFRGLSGVNREIKQQYRGYSGVNRLVFVDTYLYNSGNECTTLTGGWTNAYNSGLGNVATKEASNLYIKAGVTGVTTFGSTNKITLSNYNKLKFEIQTIKSANVANNFQLIIHTATGNPESSNAASYAVINANLARGVYEIDISALNSDYYISILSYAQHEGWLYDLWLE